MENLVDDIFEMDCNELMYFEMPIDKQFGLCIHHKNVKYEFLINIKHDSDRLIVLSSAAIPKNKKIVGKPYFNRWSWEYKESYICYNDPTLYLHPELLGGWGVGDKDNYYLEKIKDILAIIAKKISVSSENILFYGSSMGGFMSIQLATMMKDSTALAEIPQFELSRWIYWDRLKKYVFNDGDDDEIIERYGYRIDVLEMMKKEKYVPKLVLLLDFSSKTDVKLQYLDFFEKLSEFPFTGQENKIKIVIEGKNIGHGPVDKIYCQNIIDGISNKNFMIWNEEIEDSKLFIEKVLLNEKHDSLNKKYDELSSKYYSLNNKYESLNKEYDDLNSRYASLNSAHNDLTSSYESLNEKYGEITRRYNFLSSRLPKLFKRLK